MAICTNAYRLLPSNAMYRHQKPLTSSSCLSPACRPPCSGRATPRNPPPPPYGLLMFDQPLRALRLSWSSPSAAAVVLRRARRDDAWPPRAWLRRRPTPTMCGLFDSGPRSLSLSQAWPRRAQRSLGVFSNDAGSRQQAARRLPYLGMPDLAAGCSSAFLTTGRSWIWLQIAVALLLPVSKVHETLQRPHTPDPKGMSKVSGRDKCSS